MIGEIIQGMRNGIRLAGGLKDTLLFGSAEDSQGMARGALGVLAQNFGAKLGGFMAKMKEH